MKRKLMVLLLLTIIFFNANSQTLKIGQNYQGGKIISLDASKKHGFVAHFSKDKLAEDNWNTAMSEAKNADFGGFKDWRLPSFEELSIIFKRKEVLDEYVNDPPNGKVLKFGMVKEYWSSDTNGNGWPRYLRFSNGTYENVPDVWALRYIFIRTF